MKSFDGREYSRLAWLYSQVLLHLHVLFFAGKAALLEKHVHMTPTPLKRLLFEHGIKNRWLAEQCEINEANLGLIINGKRLPSIKLALKIARVLNTTVEELWGYILDEETTEEKPKE